MSRTPNRSRLCFGPTDPPTTGPSRVVTDFLDQKIIAVERLPGLHDIVRLHLGGGVDRGESAADDDRGQPQLRIRLAPDPHVDAGRGAERC
jgi:hypothetical protein